MFCLLLLCFVYCYYVLFVAIMFCLLLLCFVYCYYVLFIAIMFCLLLLCPVYYSDEKELSTWCTVTNEEYKLGLRLRIEHQKASIGLLHYIITIVLSK